MTCWSHEAPFTAPLPRHTAIIQHEKKLLNVAHVQIHGSQPNLHLVVIQNRLEFLEKKAQVRKLGKSLWRRVSEVGIHEFELFCGVEEVCSQSRRELRTQFWGRANIT